MNKYRIGGDLWVMAAQYGRYIQVRFTRDADGSPSEVCRILDRDYYGIIAFALADLGTLVHSYPWLQDLPAYCTSDGGRYCDCPMGDAQVSYLEALGLWPHRAWIFSFQLPDAPSAFISPRKGKKKMAEDDADE
jgi:hypothetical protein